MIDPEKEFASRLEIPVLHSEFDLLKEHFSAFYECERDLRPVSLAVVRSTEAAFSDSKEGIIYVGLENLEALQAELEYVHQDFGFEETIRLVLSVGIAGSVAGSHLARFASEVKHVQYTEALRDFFGSHKPIESLASELFQDGALGGNARMADSLTDHRATVINGFRYRFKLANDLLQAALVINSGPVLDSATLAMGARQRILDQYRANSGIYTDVSVYGLNQSPLLGDKLFFISMPEWLLALAQPLQDRDLATIHSESWQRD